MDRIFFIIKNFIRKRTIKYSRLSDDTIEEDTEMDILENLHNEPIIESVDNHDVYYKNDSECNHFIQFLTYDECVKKKVLINYIVSAFDNKFMWDLFSINKLKRDEYIIYNNIISSSHHNLFNKNYEEEFKKEYDTYYEYEKTNIENIYYVLKHYYILFDHLKKTQNDIVMNNEITKTFNQTALCGFCMEHIQIYEYKCNTCDNIFFTECENKFHQNNNKFLPLKKRFSKDFLNHIVCCTLNQKFAINDLYSSII